MKYYLTAFLILLLFSGCEKESTNGDENGEEGCIIEEQFASIQDDIDAASDGDTVLIQPGTYTGSINFKGKNIVVGSLFLTTGDTSYRSQTVIDANGNGSVVRFENDEGPGAELVGLTLTGGSAYEGGGIYIDNASPTLRMLNIAGNEATTCVEGKVSVIGVGGGIYMNSSEADLNIVWLHGNSAEVSGGGIFCQTSSPNFRGVEVMDNSAGDGGGIYLKASSPKMERMNIVNNEAFKGGGIFFSLSNLKLENIMITENVASDEGGGMYLNNCDLEGVNITSHYNQAGKGGAIYLTSSSFNIMNTHLFYDEIDEIYFQGSGGPNSVSISYSNVEGGQSRISTNDNGTLTWGEGNIEGEPIYDVACACNPWFVFWPVVDQPYCMASDSPGNNEGNLETEYNNVDGTRNDMGYMGGPNGDCAPN